MKEGAAARAGPSWLLVRAVAFSGLADGLFGYDTGVVSGALVAMADDMHLTTFQQEVVVSSTVLLSAAGRCCHLKRGARRSACAHGYMVVRGGASAGFRVALYVRQARCCASRSPNGSAGGRCCSQRRSSTSPARSPSR